MRTPPTAPSRADTRRSRTRARTYLALAALALAGGTLAAGPAAAEDLVEGVAAVVDTEVILLSEVEAQARIALERVQARNPNQPLPQNVVAKIQNDALKSLIDEKVVQKFAERVELAATTEEVDSTIADIARAENVTVDEIYAAAAAEGLSREDYRAELANNITQAKVISGSIRSRIRVSDEELQNVFDERYRDVRPGLRAQVRQVLIPWPGEEDAATREDARRFTQNLRERAEQTGQMAQIAAQFSAAPTAAQGGLTTLREGEVAEEIARHAFKDPLGSISPVIENPVGLSFFQVVERFDPAEIQFADVADQLRVELSESRVQPEFEKWIEEQRKQYYIEIIDQSE